ncbi:MAG: hypothetical protein LBP73_00220 [Clostridiales Family XIII bacterium]|nr:hypothetical protein [Clostridiales Family XIII bacterium]
MINIITDHEKGTVKWFYDGKEMIVENPDMIYAFEYGNEMIMLKTKNKTKGIGFILHDIKGNVILSYFLSCGKIFNGNDREIFSGALVSVDYNNVYDKVIAIVGDCSETYKLLILELSGDIVAVISHPREYYFHSTKCVKSDILAVCRGINDQTRDKYGRNDWNFRIDLNNFYVERLSITQ